MIQPQAELLKCDMVLGETDEHGPVARIMSFYEDIDDGMNQVAALSSGNACLLFDRKWSTAYFQGGQPEAGPFEAELTLGRELVYAYYQHDLIRTLPESLQYVVETSASAIRSNGEHSLAATVFPTMLAKITNQRTVDLILCPEGTRLDDYTGDPLARKPNLRLDAASILKDDEHEAIIGLYEEMREAGQELVTELHVP